MNIPDKPSIFVLFKMGVAAEAKYLELVARRQRLGLMAVQEGPLETGQAAYDAMVAALAEEAALSALPRIYRVSRNGRSGQWVLAANEGRALAHYRTHYNTPMAQNVLVQDETNAMRIQKRDPDHWRIAEMRASDYRGVITRDAFNRWEWPGAPSKAII